MAEMATSNSTETVNDTSAETAGQDVDNTDTSQDTTSETEGNGTEQDSNTTQDSSNLPADHPLVKAYASTKEQLTALKTSSQTKVQELEAQVVQLTEAAQSSDSVQAKYDRLESFLTQVGGPLSKALDSRSFTQSLFESDTDIKDLVAQWHKDNPSATSSALKSGNGSTKSSTDMNALLRSATKS